MLIKENFFNEQELELVLSMYAAAETNKVWKISKQDWEEKLVEGHKGYCRIAMSDFEILQLVTKKIETVFPQYLGCSMTVLYHKWPYNSAINPHRDSAKLFGATIYLNSTWNKEQGGLFCWKDKETESEHYLIPTLNTIVLLDNGEQHWVTPNVGVKDRKTLQIWGYKPD